MRLVDYVVLPREITAFERQYLARVNRIALYFFASHVPVFTLIAYFNDTKPLLALGLTAFVLAGPWLAVGSLKNPRNVSIVMGVTAMAMGALLVNFGRGAMTIEMHFYFFVLLALLTVFANPMPIIVAAVTVALHHAVLWATLPVAVFNYDAPFAAVFVHALFVVIESFAACFVARSVFDNVIGLDRIVQARTKELDERNRALSEVLDNVDQGFIRLDSAALVPKEYSKIFDAWLGAPKPSDTFFAWLGRSDQRTSEWLEVGWEAVFEGTLPVETTLGQLPILAAFGERVFSLRYLPIQDGDRVTSVLIVMSDVTAERAQERAEEERTELLVVVERMMSDRAGFLAFLDEASRLVDLLEPNGARPVVVRALHTLKGNFGLFGLTSLARLCHEQEDHLADEADVGVEHVEPVREAWSSFVRRLGSVLGQREEVVEIRKVEYDGLRAAVRDGDIDQRGLLLRLDRYLKEPAQKRLELLAEQARSLATRFEKGELEVEISGGDVRLPQRRWTPLWAALVHVVRNAIDHGIESPDERSSLGKTAAPLLSLRLREVGSEIELTVEDNGRGIDFSKVRAKAQALGIPADSDSELTQALFVEGLSTRDEVSEISGRGVGMSAVQRACEELGGHIDVQTAYGQGTRFVLRIPDRSTYAPVAAE